MSIRDDFRPYIDGNGLLAPSPTGGELSASNNGVMYTSEYYVMLCKNNVLTKNDYGGFEVLIGDCVEPKGFLNRKPTNQSSDQEGPDDYYAALNACIHLGNTDMPRIFLRTIIQNLGFMNNGGHPRTGSSFLARQPQLLTSMVSAAFPKRFSLRQFLVRLLAFPLYLITAVIIATSCINSHAYDTDARRLAWHLIQTTAKTSLLCYLASIIWYRRLYKTYQNGMSDVAALYYHPTHNNPYAKYWITR